MKTTARTTKSRPKATFQSKKYEIDDFGFALRWFGSQQPEHDPDGLNKLTKALAEHCRPTRDALRSAYACMEGMARQEHKIHSLYPDWAGDLFSLVKHLIARAKIEAAEEARALLAAHKQHRPTPGKI